MVEGKGHQIKKDKVYKRELHLYFDDRDNRTEDLQYLRPNGFTEERLISDFPARARKRTRLPHNINPPALRWHPPAAALPPDSPLPSRPTSGLLRCYAAPQPLASQPLSATADIPFQGKSRSLRPRRRSWCRGRLLR